MTKQEKKQYRELKQLSSDVLSAIYTCFGDYEKETCEASQADAICKICKERGRGKRGRGEHK